MGPFLRNTYVNIGYELHICESMAKYIGLFVVKYI